MSWLLKKHSRYLWDMGVPLFRPSTVSLRDSYSPASLRKAESFEVCGRGVRTSREAVTQDLQDAKALLDALG